MGALTTYSKTLLLAQLFASGAYVALHDGDPGADGSANEIDTGQDADYARQSVTMAAEAGSSGQRVNSTQVAWTVATGSAGHTVTHCTIWDAATGGNCEMKGQLLASRDLVADDVFTLEIGEVVAIID